MNANVISGVAVQNVKRSRTSFYMSKVSGSCQRLAVHVKGKRFISKVSATFRLAACQSGMYIRSRMPFHLVLSVVYGLLTCVTQVNVYCDQRKLGDCRINL